MPRPCTLCAGFRKLFAASAVVLVQTTSNRSIPWVHHKLADAMQVMSTQMSHINMAGPGGLQASVCLLTSKEGIRWHSRLRPGLVIRNTLPSALCLQVTSHIPCEAMSTPEGAAVGTYLVFYRQVSLWMAHSDRQATTVQLLQVLLSPYDSLHIGPATLSSL